MIITDFFAFIYWYMYLFSMPIAPHKQRFHSCSFNTDTTVLESLQAVKQNLIHQKVDLESWTCNIDGQSLRKVYSSKVSPELSFPL